MHIFQMNYRYVCLFFWILSICCSRAGLSQSPDIPLNRDYYYLIDRYEILTGSASPGIHTSVKPYKRNQVAEFFAGLDSLRTNNNRRDKFNIDYVLTDNYAYTEYPAAKSGRPVLKYLYTYKSDFFSVDIPDFQMHLNPVMYFSGGIDLDRNVTPYINTRGLEISGLLAGKIAYYTFLSTTQAAFPGYVRSWIVRNLAVPNEGFWKVYNKDGVDFFTASGYFSFNIVKPVLVQAGHGKTFIGNGIRSMALSDFSNNYLYLKMDVKIWKLDYFNLFAQNYADAYASANTGSLGGTYPKKFLAHHHLSFNAGRNLNLGIFETVIVGDSTHAFEIGYLNPLIFYRALEHQGGSRNNVFVGADVKWNFLNHFSLYSQLLLDEFKLDEVTSGEGWWANKYGAQAGLKYMNVAGIENLDAQLEFNISKPYTYSHKDIYTNFSNYRMPLAHPYGANFREWIFSARYQPMPRLMLNLTGINSAYGEDDPGSNWGKNIMKSYLTRERDYGNFTGQGYKTWFKYLNMAVTYQLRHNVFFDLEFTLHDISSEYDPLDSRTTYSGMNFRWNIPKKIFDY
ncbi:MAG TPA: hypothetical protein VI583_05590 [Cyclobacteriaceae bacterium]|nr:hypothetical protein [Cyclobacteriaceae bacterium]